MKTTMQIRESVAFKLTLGIIYLTFMLAAMLAGWFFSSASYFVSI